MGLISHLTLDPSSSASGAPRQLRCAFLADPHLAADPRQIDHGRNMSNNLERTAAEVASAAPDVALLLGDVAWQQGCPGDYAQFRRLIQPLEAATPLCLTPGNHDDRQNFLAAFSPVAVADGAVPEKSIVILERDWFRVILLDSLFRNDLVPGLLGKAQRDWLGDFLAASDPLITLVGVHHPLADGDTNLLDSARLLDLLRSYPQVKAVIHGHDHAFRHGSEGGLHVIGLPAVGMPLEGDEALGWIEARLDEEGARLRFHVAEGSLPAGLPAQQHLRWRR